jgi:LacI family transcriptional regulator
MPKQKPTIRDVAHAANVSAAAVSIVINGRPGVSLDTRERVWQTITSLGYSIRPPVEDGKPQAVGLLIEKSSMPVILDIFYGQVIGGFQAEAQRLGFHVVLHMFDRSAENLDGLRGRLASQVRGLVVANDGDIAPEMVIRLGALNLPLVLIENCIAGQRLPCVVGDNFTAGYTVMQHLLSLGHRAIAVLPGPHKYSSLVERVRGCLAGAAEAGLLIPPEWIPQPSSGHPKKGYLQMQEILHQRNKPTAVVAVSDKTAFGAMEAIKESGLRIPEDMAIVSIDDVSESAYSQPALTTYRIPKYEMGILAMQKLQRLISGEAEIPVKSIVYGELIVRQSCGAHLHAGKVIGEPRYSGAC